MLTVLGLQTAEKRMVAAAPTRRGNLPLSLPWRPPAHQLDPLTGVEDSIFPQVPRATAGAGRRAERPPPDALSTP